MQDKLTITNKLVFSIGILLFIIGLMSIFVLQDYLLLQILTPIACSGATFISLISSVDFKSNINISKKQN